MTILRFARFGGVLLAVLVLVLVAVRWANSRTRPPANLGLVDGRLSSCPDRPNCVSTQASDPEQSFPSLPLTQPAAAAMSEFESIIREMPRTRIRTSSDNYLHAEIRSPVFGFVDDLEIACDEATQSIHLRSAARIGYSDLDVNRRRAEALTSLYRQRVNSAEPTP